MEYRESSKFIGSYCRLLFFCFLSVIDVEDFCIISFVAQSLTSRRETDQLPLPETFTIQTPIADTFTGSLC